MSDYPELRSAVLLEEQSRLILGTWGAFGWYLSFLPVPSFSFLGPRFRDGRIYLLGHFKREAVLVCKKGKLKRDLIVTQLLR